LDAGEGFRYKWSTGDTTRTITVSSSGNYSVSIENINGCKTTSLSKKVNVKPAPSIPSIIFYGDTVLCGVDSFRAVVKKTPGLSFKWFRNGGVFNNGDTSVWIKRDGLYQLFVDAANGCSAFRQFSVREDPALSPGINVMNTEGCEGDSFLLFATYGGGPEPAYTWIMDGDTLPENSEMITVKKTGAYRVFLRRGLCSDISKAVNINVRPYPVAKLNIPSGKYTLCKGDSIVLRSLYNNSGYGYTWYKGAGVDPFRMDSFYTVKESGTYKLMISNSHCRDTSQTVEVVVIPHPDASIVPSGPQVLCGSHAIKLTAAADTGATYSWFRNGNFINAGSGLTVTDSGRYVVVMSYKNGCTDTAVSVIRKIIPAKAEVSIQGDTVFCSGGKVVLKALFGSQYSYAWLKDGVAQSGKDSSFGAVASGKYRLVLITGGACPDTSRSVTVKVLPAPAVMLTYDGVKTLSVDYQPSYSYEWYWNNTIISGVTGYTYIPTKIGVYKVKVTGNNGCSIFTNPVYLSTISGIMETGFKPGLDIFPNPSSQHSLQQSRIGAVDHPACRCGGKGNCIKPK
jgi:hypothetical protein